MIREDFYANLNGILDSCGWDMLGGKKDVTSWHIHGKNIIARIV